MALTDYLHDLAGAEYLSPELFWLLLPAALLCVLCLLRDRSLWFARGLRLLALLLAITALADPVKKDSSSEEELVALLDVSRSVSDRAHAALLEQLAEFGRAGRNLTLKVVPFGRQPSAKPAVIPGGSGVAEIAEAVAGAAERVDSGETNIGAALSSVAGRSENASILLLSDGIETSGNARLAAKLGANRNVRIFPLIPGERVFRSEGLSLSSVQAPLVVNAGDVAEINAAVRSTEQKTASAVVELWLEQKKLLSREVEVPAGEERLVTVKTPPLEGGLKRVRAVLRDADGREKNEAELHRWISVKNRTRLLLLSGTAEDRRVLRQLFALKGYAIEDIVADGSVPIPKTFEDYSGVILNNASQPQLPAGFLPALKDFVQHGGGLLLVGGDRSYGLGQYIGTPLEEVSPVKFVPPQTTKRRLNSAVILLIDKSRSMMFEDKLEGAKGGAQLAIESLKDDDYAGVIGFDSAPFVVIRLGPVSEVKPIAAHRLENLTAAGKTDLLPALAAARQSLAHAPAARKHMIVLSDGKVPLAGNEYVEELSRLRAEGITLSTVALGADADAPFMQMLSQYGHGAFYQTLESSRLPQIFIHDIQVATGEKTMKEQEEFPVGLGPSGLISTKQNPYPDLRGFVETAPKPGANLELVVHQQDKSFPLLASWSFGSGKVAAFTSDANGRWSMPWLNWAGFPKFWSDLVAAIEHTGEAKSGQIDFDLRYSVNRRSLLLDLAVFDEKLLHDSSPKVTGEAVLPGGETRSVTFLPQKKGRFSAVIENARPGDYRLNLAYGAVHFPPLAMTIPGDAFGEVAGQGVNIQNLAELAYLSGGAVNPNPGQVVSAKHETSRYTHLYAPLLLAAFLLILLEAFVREGALGVLFVPLRRVRQLFAAVSPAPSGIYKSKRRAAP